MVEVQDAGPPDLHRHVKDAFRWVPFHEMDACIFGADLDGQEWGIAAFIVAIYWVLTFGWKPRRVDDLGMDSKALPRRLSPAR